MKKSKPEQFEVPVGTACGCELCAVDQQSESPDVRGYCVGCGHGYLIFGEGMCGRCGSRAFSAERPDLSPASMRMFTAEVRRSVEQSGRITVMARTEKEARRLAYVADMRAVTWQQGKEFAPYCIEAAEVLPTEPQEPPR